MGVFKNWFPWQHLIVNRLHDRRYLELIWAFNALVNALIDLLLPKFQCGHLLLEEKMLTLRLEPFAIVFFDDLHFAFQGPQVGYSLP